MTLTQTTLLLLSNLRRLSRSINLRSTMGIGSRRENLFTRSLCTERSTRKLSLINRKRLSSLSSTWEKMSKGECNPTLKSIWKKGLCSYFQQPLYWYCSPRSLLHNYAPCLKKKTLSRTPKIKLYNFGRLATLSDTLLFSKHWEYSVIGKILNSRLSSITNSKIILKTKSPG